MDEPGDFSLSVVGTTRSMSDLLWKSGSTASDFLVSSWVSWIICMHCAITL